MKNQKLKFNMIEKQTCWDKGIGQSLFMSLGSIINIAGGVVSLIVSAQKETIDPTVFVCCSMLTSTMYLGANSYRAYQINQETGCNNFFQDKIARERESGIEVVINR